MSASSPLSRRWFALVLVLCLGLIAMDAVWNARYYDRISAGLGSRPPPAFEARQRIIPLNGMDGFYWIQYAQEMAAGGRLRVREVHMDNAPFGREQHWHSGFAWWLVILGRARHAVTGESVSHGIEMMAAYANPLLLAVFVTFFALVTGRRFGWAAGAWLAVAMIGSQPFFAAFPPNQPGHHGLDSAAALGTVLFLLMGGFGWVRANGVVAGPGASLVPAGAEAKKWFVLSALSGAAGLWFSAVTQIQIFLGVGLGALAVGFLMGRTHRAGPVCRPELWRLWGRVGALGSLGFYLIEYFPSHFGLRLEVNHPFFAAAWWGAGELLASFFGWRAGGALWPVARAERLRLAAAGLALVLPPATIIIGGAQWCCLRDPIQWRIATVVSEGLPVLKIGPRVGWPRMAGYLGGPLLLLLLGAAAACVRRIGRAERVLLVGSLLAALPVAVDSMLQNRWILILGAASLPPFVGAVAVLPRVLSGRMRLVLTLTLAGLALFDGLPVCEFRIARAWLNSTSALVSVNQDDIYMVFMRHVAQMLRRRPGADGSTVLASPNDSAALIYYGGFRGLGTLYWENNDGIKAAAAIYAAESDEIARQLIAARGIRYLVKSSEHHFVDGYCFLATGSHDLETVHKSFAFRIFFKGALPVWLRPVRLPELPGLASSGISAIAYEYAPDQTPAGFWLNIGETNFENRQYEAAVRCYKTSLGSSPASAPALTGLAMAFAELGRPAESEAAFARACQLVPGASLAQLNFKLGSHYQNRGDYARACAHYETSLKLAPENPVSLSRLAWLLAAAPGPELRNGARAVQLARRVVQLTGVPAAQMCDTLAAALAGSGDFSQAVAIEQQALTLARKAGNGGLAGEIESRLRLYQQGQPFRLPAASAMP